MQSSGKLQGLILSPLRQESKRPRYYCAGAETNRREPGKKLCDYKAPKKWSSRIENGRRISTCPKCERHFACLPIRKGKNEASRITLGAETMDKAKPMVYHSTGIPELDKILGGGVVLTKTLLLGGSRGCGKTTMLLQACDGFAHNGKKAYFASGEMTREACIDYAKRLGIVNENVGLFGDPQGLDVEALFDDVLAFGARLAHYRFASNLDCARCQGRHRISVHGYAVANMVTSFAQAKKRSVIMIGHLQKTGDYGGTEKVQHLVDGLVRMENKWAGMDELSGKPIDSMIRELYMDGKSRQGRADITSLVELTDDGIRPPSVAAMRKIRDQHVKL